MQGLAAAYDPALHQQIGLNVAVDGNLIVASGGIADPGVQLNPSGDIFNPLPNPDPSNSKVGKVYVWNATNGTALSVLLDDDEIQTDDFGRSISIADGIVAVGEPFEKVGNVIVGAAHLYNATNGAHLRKLLPSNVSVEGRFGWGVASDGRNVVVSDPSANRLRVFAISSGEEVEDLTYGASGIRLGYKIAMDGDLLAAGAVYDSTEKQSGGSIQLFEHSRVTEGAGRWGAAVTAASGKIVTGSPDYQWGNQLLAGSATHFRASTGTYQSLTFPGGTLAEDHFGTSLGMDLNYTAVGSPGKDRSLFTNAGLVYVFGSQAAGYIHTLVPDKVQANAQFGAALDLNDGRVIVGAPGANGSKGAAYLYNPYSTNLLHKFEAPTGNAGDRLGQSVSVALSASRGGANLAVIGIPQDNNTKGTDAGRVDIYNALTGTLIKSLTSDKVDAGAKFGTAVVVREKILAIGAPKANHGGSNTGSVFVYDAKSLALRYVLTGGASANANGGFGSAIATDGRLIAVGAPNDDEIRPGAGAVYLFRATDGLLLRKFAVNLGNDSAHLGMSIALERGKVIVGAPDHDRLLAVAPGVTFPLVDAGATVEFDVKALLSDSNLFGGEPQIISQTTKEIKAIAPVFRGYVLEYSTNEANWYFLGAYEGAGQQQTIQIPSGVVAKYIRARGL